MDKQKERENFDYFDEHRPEPKLELVNGRLIAGNSLAGSRLLLDHILRGWMVDAAAALGSMEQWIAGLREVYGLPQPMRIDEGTIAALEQQAAHIEYTAPDFTASAEGEDAGHRRVREHLYYWLWETSEVLGGHTLGRDFVMRIGEDAFTPDIVFFKNTKLNTLHEYYLAGPAEMVIEVIRPAHRDCDYRVKRDYYARGGVPEYVIVDPERRQVEFFRLVNSDYVVQQPDADGCYRPRSVPGLAIATQHLWVDEERFSFRGEHNPFVVEQPQRAAERARGIDDGLGWGELPFAPRLDLQPVPLRFEEYICWSPESKLEFWDGRIQISGDEGVRNLTGMLLATIGISEACRYAPPAAWLAALRRRSEMEARDGQIRREWRARAAKAAEVLRAKYGAARIAITGDLVSERPLGFWSRLTLAVWGTPSQDILRIYEDLSAMDIEIVEADRKYFQEKLDNGQLMLEEI